MATVTITLSDDDTTGEVSINLKAEPAIPGGLSEETPTPAQNMALQLMQALAGGAQVDYEEDEE